MKNCVLIKGFFLSFILLAVLIWGAFNTVNRYYADSDNALFYIYCAAKPSDLSFLEQNLIVFKNRARKRDAEIQLIILGASKNIALSPLERMYVNIGRRIANKEKIDKSELLKFSNNIRYDVIKLEYAERLIYMTLTFNRYEIINDILTAFGVDEFLPYMTMAYNGRKAAYKNIIQRSYKYEYDLVEESLYNPNKCLVIERVKKRYSLLKKGTYYKEKILLSMCASNCGNNMLSKEILENMYYVASTPPFNYPSHRIYVRKLIAIHLALDKNIDTMLKTLYTAPSIRDATKLASDVSAYLTISTDARTSISTIKSFFCLENQLKFYFLPSSPPLFLHQ